MSFQRVALGEVLKRVERFEERDDLKEYHFAGTYSFGRGIFAGGKKLGATFKLDRIQRIHADDFVYCKIMAWEGAFGIVPIKAHNCVMSGAFVAYEVDKTKIDPRYLDFYFKISSVWKFIGGQSTGTNIRRRNLHPNQFESALIPLPPLPEQHRIVARIEELAAKIEEARGLKRMAGEEMEALIRSKMNLLFGNPYYNKSGDLGINRFTRLNDVVIDVADGPHVTPTYVENGIPFVTALNTTSGHVNFSNLKYITLDDHRQFQKRAQVEKGDVLITKDGTIGIPCYVDTDQEFSFFVSVALIKPKRDILDGRFLTWALRTPYLQERIRERSRGDMIRHLVLREIRDLIVPIPPLPEQRRIVTYLDSLKTEVDALRRLQAETSAELDALLPAVLDRAFKGELSEKRGNLD